MVPPDTSTSGDKVQRVGTRRGHAWEQLDLPRHARGGILLSLGNTAPLMSRRQVIVIHDAGVFSTPEAYSWSFRAWYKWLQTLLVRSGIQVVTVSAFSRAEIIRYLGGHADRVAVIGEGADHMNRIVADPGVLASAGLMPGRFVLAVGNLAAHKNLAALGELARVLAARDMTLVIAGGLPAGAFKDDGDVLLPRPARYVGRVGDGALKALYQAAACFVFPSRYEGFGLPAVEAMACDCPVVAADIPALRETCGKAALYGGPGSPQDIAFQVCRVLDEDGLAHRLRQAGTEQVSQYTWDRAAWALNRVIAALPPASRSLAGYGPEETPACVSR